MEEKLLGNILYIYIEETNCCNKLCMRRGESGMSTECGAEESLTVASLECEQ
jgi:hypothetical protein